MIVGVAVKFDDEEIRLEKPNRHSDCFTVRTNSGKEVGIGAKAINQGFYTENGEYLNRQQAMVYVREIGQKLIPDWQTGKVNQTYALFSEDLW
jgi:hypothetical protein